MSPSIVTRDNNLYTLLHAFSYLHTRIHFRPSMLFTVYDNILSRFTYKTLPRLSTCVSISSNQEGTFIFDVLRLNAQTKNLATLKTVCWDSLLSWALVCLANVCALRERTLDIQAKF